MKVKKIVCMILAMVMMCTAFMSSTISLSSVSAAEVEDINAMGVTSGDYQYKVLNDGTAEITRYTGSASGLTIPSKLDGYSVSSIMKAFWGCKTLTSVSIPDSVTIIGENAFKDCTRLISIVIPDSVKIIENNAFCYCENLINVKIPNSVTSIGHDAFDGCTSLTSVTISNSATSIESNVFWECTSLTSIVIPSSVSKIGINAFWGCTSLSSLTINNSVKIISSGAFHECTSLVDVYYDGTIDEWNNISIGNSNAELINANIHCKEKQNQTINLSKTSYTKKYGDKSFNLNASAKTSLQYSSSNTKVATVSSNGTVTIKGSGSATITITAISDEQYNSAVKTVKITVNKATQTITAKSYTKKNGSKAFSLGAKTNGGGKLTYTTSNKNIATVSSKGVVSINGCGKATITIKASTTSKYNSAIKKVYITVLPSDVKITSLTGKRNTAKMTFKKQQGLSGYVVEISQKSNFSFKLSNILKGNRGDCNFRGCTKGKKYYARIRAFVKIGGKTYYSKWANRSFAIKR